jgi:hypothetical protein
MSKGLRELLLVLAGATALTVVMTWPLAPKMTHVGRIDNGDGQFSIWNVSWVARTLVVDPAHVFDANIFYPHKYTLAYSESNLGAGVLAIPAYWTTRNPFAALNFVALLSFVLAGAGMYYLVRHLTGHRGAAALSGICFAFNPYAFAHSAQIQLLMTAGLPFSMFMFHRFVDRISPTRGAALGAVMAAQAICCGYYGIFAILMVGWAVVVVATTRRLWTDARYWLSLATGGAVSIALVFPAFVPYLRLQRVEGFHRTLDQARQFSAHWSDYLASSAHAHAWMLSHLPPWVEVTFPGFVATAFGLAGAWIVRKRGRGEILAIYGGLIVLAAWASFGPVGGLYSVLYKAVPVFSWLRAPGRFGLIVDLSIVVLAGVAVAALASRAKRPSLVIALLAVVALGELTTASNQREVEPFEPMYKTLASMPPGPVVEMPFFYIQTDFFRHTHYMMNSTTHWMPLVNGYSDYTPTDFAERIETLKFLPSRDALRMLAGDHVRYAAFHMYWYNAENQHDVLTRLKELEQYFRPLYIDADTRLYEIVGAPQ